MEDCWAQNNRENLYKAYGTDKLFILLWMYIIHMEMLSRALLVDETWVFAHAGTKKVKALAW